MNGIQQFLENMVTGLVRFSSAVEKIVSNFFHGLLKFLENTYNWLLNTAKRIADYLLRFFPALGNVLFALVKLCLFYVPSLICVVVYIAIHRHIGWPIAGGVWALFITGVGLTYGKNKNLDTA
jgi:hypothetical protein